MLRPTSSPASQSGNSGKGTIVAAIIGAVAVVAAAFVTAGYFKKDPVGKINASLDRQLTVPAGYQAKKYPQFGFGFVAPSSWKVEDDVAKYGVPDIAIIQRNIDSKAALGVKFGLSAVPANYINDVSSEFGNFEAVIKATDGSATLGDASVGGFPAKMARYTQVLGGRKGVVAKGDILKYNVRISPEVKLEITAFTYVGEADAADFWKEVDAIIRSVVIEQPSQP